MIRIMLVDDHPFIRAGIKAVLSDDSDFVVVDEASNGNEAVDKIRHHKPDIVILDISLPQKSGLDILKLIHPEMPDLKFLMLSTYSEKEYALRCFRSGALGYLRKDGASTELISALRKIMKGRRYISPEIADLLIDKLDDNSDRAPHESLSDREYQILCLIGQGNTVSQIADLLSVSISTVNTYRTRILRKMNLKSTAQLIRYVHEYQLVLNMDQP